MSLSWSGVNVGDKVKVIASHEQLEDIAAEEFRGYIGTVDRVKKDVVTVRFVNDVRLFNTYMLEKTNGGYEEWLDTPEADLLAQAYGELSC